jgi:hypothetical protein
MNNGGARSMNGSTNSVAILLTSFGMRSGCLTQAGTKNWDRSKSELDADDTSKMNTEEPSTFYSMVIDQVCAWMFSIEMRALNHSGEKRAPA